MAFLAQLLAGWFIADLLSACFHIALDALGGTRAERWPFLGQMVRDFRGHHEEPLNQEYLGYSLFALAPATVMLALTGSALTALLLPCGVVFAVTVGLGIALSQATHRWAHAEAPRLVRWGQRCGLLLSPRRHAGHHVAFDRDFGSVNGWSHLMVNAVLWLAGW